MKQVRIPISTEDSYILDTLNVDRHLRAFNRGLRGITIPVGPFHEPLHEQALYETDPCRRREVSQIINLYGSREPRYNACVTDIEYDDSLGRYVANVTWHEKEPHPLVIRITAIMQGKRCIRVVQFGVE